MQSRSCVFCDIVAGLSPSSVVHSDEHCLAFMDILPVTPGHLLVVPRVHATYLADLPSAVGKALFETTLLLADAVRRSGLRVEGINLFLADGEAAGQEVFHVHVHVLPRFKGDGFGLRLPPGYGSEATREQLDAHAATIRSALGANSS